MLPAAVKEGIERDLTGSLGKEIRILSSASLGGGCINHALRINTTAGDFFAKWNRAGAFPGMFAAETKGLELLRNTKVIPIPCVIASGEAGNHAWLVLELVNAGKTAKNFWEEFGKSVARLHKNTAPQFGLDHDNYIGSLPQSNDRKLTWTDFFIHQRLEPQLKMAVDSGAAPSGLIQAFEKFFLQFPERVPVELPALLHGDLWKGNYMISPEGKACLIDPAIYYGHREMDLAMTRLFGGFEEAFYVGYQDAFPLQPGFEKRTDIHNLYPLMVHVNLFGGSYLRSVENILKQY